MGLPCPARRGFLHRSLAIGGALLFPGSVRAGELRTVTGQVFVNGRPAEAGSPFNPGGEILAGPNGSAVFTIGQDAFLVRSLASIQIDKGSNSAVITGLRVLTGALMGVFGRGQAKTIRTATVTTGIRGTGIYLEASRETTYFCTCYGEVELECQTSGTRINVRATDHTPHNIHSAMLSGRTIVRESFKNHSNEKLAMLERLVGRTSPLK